MSLPERYLTTTCYPMAVRAEPMTGSLIAGASPSVNISLGGLHSPSTSVVIIAALTILSIAPSVLILFTGFTRSSSSSA